MDDNTPDWAYDEDGYCVCCGNGRWKFHAVECGLRDLLDLKDRSCVTCTHVDISPKYPVEEIGVGCVKFTSSRFTHTYYCSLWEPRKDPQ